LARMTDALLHGAAFEPDPEVVARLERLEEDAVPEKPAAADVSSPALELNFDPEIAAIFMEEAAEILESAESALGTLRSEGEGSSSIVELQRLLHTLKGGARMAGVLPMGDLSHALETLLVGMAEKRVEPAAPTLDLLQQCLDTLHAMRDCIDAGKPVPGAAELVARIEAVSFPGLSSAVTPAEPAEAAPEGASEPSAEPAAEASRPQGDEPTVRQLAPAFDG